MEEEDFPYPKPFFLQSANISNPTQQKQLKPSFFKMQSQPFFFYHTNKFHTYPSSNIQLSEQVIHHLTLKNS